MRTVPRSTPVVYSGASTKRERSTLVVFLGVAVMLVAWVALFVAFLLAPLFVLLAAWIVGFTALAIRHRQRSGGSGQRALTAAGTTHRFGGAATDADGDAA